MSRFLENERLPALVDGMTSQWGSVFWRSQIASQDHTARSATGIGTFAALMDGRAAPTSAIITAHKIPIATSGKVTERLKTLLPRTFSWSSNNIHALDAPIMAPTKDKKIASKITD